MTQPKADRTLIGSIRDRIGWALACLGMFIATPWYREMIRGSIELGLRTAATPRPADILKRPVPPPVPPRPEPMVKVSP